MTRRGDALRLELRSLDDALSAFPSDDPEPFSASAMTRSDLVRFRERLIAQLADAEVGVLDVVFEGEAVRDRSVNVDLVVDTLGPFQEAVASVGQALEEAITRAGLIPQPIRALTSLRLAGTFDGSFGIKLEGPPPELQLSLVPDPETGEEESVSTLFERSMRRVLDALQAANSEEWEQSIVDQIADLGPRFQGHLENLSSALARASRARFVWRAPEAAPRVVTVTPEAAKQMRTVLTHLESSEDELVISGQLLGLDLLNRTFAAQADDEVVYRGRFATELADELEGLFHRPVVAVIKATKTRSTVGGRETTRYFLVELR